MLSRKRIGDRGTHQSKDLKGASVDLASTVGNNADDDFPPTISAPRLGAISTTEMSNILDDTVKNP